MRNLKENWTIVDRIEAMLECAIQSDGFAHDIDVVDDSFVLEMEVSKYDSPLVFKGNLLVNYDFNNLNEYHFTLNGKMDVEMSDESLLPFMKNSSFNVHNESTFSIGHDLDESEAFSVYIHEAEHLLEKIVGYYELKLFSAKICGGSMIAFEDLDTKGSLETAIHSNTLKEEKASVENTIIRYVEACMPILSEIFDFVRKDYGATWTLNSLDDTRLELYVDFYRRCMTLHEIYGRGGGFFNQNKACIFSRKISEFNLFDLSSWNKRIKDLAEYNAPKF